MKMVTKRYQRKYTIEPICAVTYWHSLWEARQSRPCTHSGRSSLLWEIPQMTHPSCCMLRRCSFGDARLAEISMPHGESNSDAVQLTDCGEFAARCAHHGQLAHFAASSEVEQRQSYNSNLLIRLGCASSYESRRILSSTNLDLQSAL